MFGENLHEGSMEVAFNGISTVKREAVSDNIYPVLTECRVI